MTYISHFRFQPDIDDPRLRQATLEEYQAARSHTERPIKERSDMEAPPLALTECRVEIRPVHTSRDENLQRLLMHHQSRCFALQADNPVKIVGYNSKDGDTVATTGTSQVNTLCLTDGMGPCIGVAIGGENLSNGVPSIGAKVRVFHVFPRNANSKEELRAYIEKIQQRGLTVRAAMHGGDAYVPESREQAKNLRALFSEMDVQVDFDEACEKRAGDKPIGGVIHDNHTVQFITELEQTAL